MRVLILGGYGVFGGRLTRLLLQDGVEVIVAGRNAAKAAAFTARYGGSPLAIDIARDLSPIAEAAPALVADAAGPFQAYGGDPYRVARFCIERKINYLDFSDDAAFTAGIAALDGAAREAGAFALSGVSTVPAISAAAARALSEGLSEIALIETALMPGNRAPRGRSVIRSILAQAGEPLRMWRGGAWREARGWADAKRFAFGPGLKRWASLIGAPDLTLFPQAFRARSVVFRAGLELGVMHWGLAAMAALRAKGLLPRLTLFSGPILWASLLLKPFGTDRGGMTVDVTGIEQGRTLRRRWEVIATGGDGPYIPAVPARAIVRKAAAISPGARPCLGELSLEDIQDASRGLAVEFAISEQEAPALFEAALAGDWPALPSSIRRLHSVPDWESFSGRAEVIRNPVEEFAKAPSPLSPLPRRGEGNALSAGAAELPSPPANPLADLATSGGKLAKASLLGEGLGARGLLLRPANSSTGFGITRGGGLFAGLAAWLFSFPGAGADIALTVTKRRSGAGEVWERDFAGQKFRSYWSASRRARCVIERFRPFAFEFELAADAAGMRYALRRGWLAGIPLPRTLLPKAAIREYEEGGAFRFDVALYAPLTGALIVRYRGWLSGPD